ncbi:GlxA family transcriptional regulator [Microbacterium sp. SORGH_AS_0888]|uniref:GlxA family transcriptional regulator n=1 Tax=Microbacterium sp. SORGH_AS_0888 TaxID=3041791 RepID=UPI0027823393|nr:DJ-1/PfpI family protein [Microbacterium sp. SORGH_AS_0888]MDQ1131234.1 transcriptional regulator GlxA family with amidase domain [Microbacterium sp. SORGH_AS_0888]
MTPPVADDAVRAVFLLAPGVQLLDVAGPAHVFGGVAEATGRRWELSYVADRPLVDSHQGVPLHADTLLPALTARDLVVVPGWHIDDDARAPFASSTLAWVRAHHDRGGAVMSVCAGAFALAEAGLLDGRRATTHHDLQDELARRFPAVRVSRDVLYASDGSVHTSAGIASGIDLALHLVAQQYGARAASRIARAMVVFARRNGHEPQESVMLRHRDHLDDLVHRAQDVLDDRFAERVPLELLAREVRASERTVTRAFVRALGMTPLRYQQLLRREHAERLIAAGESVEAAARAVGFDDARMLRRLRSAAAQ